MTRRMIMMPYAQAGTLVEVIVEVLTVVTVCVVAGPDRVVVTVDVEVVGVGGGVYEN